MTVNVLIPPAELVEPMKGRRFVITRRGAGAEVWYDLTRPTGRQAIAQGDTAEELAQWARKQGAKSAELI